MKRFLTSICIMAAGIAVFAQTTKKEETKQPDYQFTTVRENPITPVKNQFRSGTCWCFSSLSFIESEALRTTKKTFDLSEMWIVSHAYHDRAVKFVRLDGNLRFSAGSTFADVMAVVKKYGMVPEDVYSGMQYGYDLPEQAELDAVLKAYVNALVSKPNKTSTRPWTLSTAWKDGFDGILQAYMGKWPESFTVEGKTCTPASYRDDVVKFNPDDYINICSFQEEPWFQFCPVEVCDNWRNAPGFNVPMEDMMRIIYNALDNGYTVLWGGDVSEKGFNREGLGVLPKPQKNAKPAAGSDQEHWVGKDTSKQEEVTVTIPEEVEVSDSLRQSAYDRKMTTDDHGMHIYGYAKDQNGTKYLMTKNSWGTAGKYNGIWYLSDTFVRYKTLNFIIHKDALPKDIRKKLGK